MKIRMRFGMACGLVIAVASFQASAQSMASATAPSGASQSASSVPAKSAKAGNRALRRQVYAAIVKHQEISAGSISVVARGGAVTLDGTVTDATQIDKVAEITKAVPGVVSVTNRLTVKKSFSGE